MNHYITSKAQFSTGERAVVVTMELHGWGTVTYQLFGDRRRDFSWFQKWSQTLHTFFRRDWQNFSRDHKPKSPSCTIPTYKNKTNKKATPTHTHTHTRTHAGTPARTHTNTSKISNTHTHVKEPVANVRTRWINKHKIHISGVDSELC